MIFSLEVHDIIFSIGALAFGLALIPAVKSKAILPVTTTGLTSFWLWIFALTYIDMEFWYAVVTQVISAMLWTYLLKLSLENNER